MFSSKDNRMRIEAPKKRFTVDEYYRMADAGAFASGERVELINGEIIKMSAIGVRHAACVARANERFIMALAGRVTISPQNPLRLNTLNEPEPDLVILKPRRDHYAGKRAQAEDSILVIEVSDSSLRYDHEIKLPIYAAALVPEVWIENLSANEILVYRDPDGEKYQTVFSRQIGESISPAAFPDLVFQVSDLLP